MQQTLVIGLGKTGQSMARHLQRQFISFVMYDTRESPLEYMECQALFPETSIYLGALPDAVLQTVSTILCSPGVPLDAPVLQRAREKNIPILGDVECFARVVDKPVIAITGTNGKSTVTMLVGEMAKAAGLLVAVAGNIGMPVLDRLNDGVAYDLWVLELSSFQLDLIESLRPIVATILNVTPDHLDRHHSLMAYWEAKQRIYLGANACVYNREDERTEPDLIYSDASDGVRRSFGLDEPESHQWGIRCDAEGNPHLARGDRMIMPVSMLRIKGRHNWANALAACALAEVAQIPIACMVSVLSQFAGLPHRCQWVREHDDVIFINDSKGTNVGATQSAIAGIGGAMQGKIVLIAGGQGKGADFVSLSDVVQSYVRHVILIGEDAEKLALALKDAVSIEHAVSMEDAVQRAHKCAQVGDVVLLSPACASLDMFHDFNHRGDVFTHAVGAL